MSKKKTTEKQKSAENNVTAQNDTTETVKIEAVMATSQEATQTEVSEIVDELAATPKRQRIWEVDFLRGLMILFVVWDHLMWDLVAFRPYKTEFFTAVYNFALNYEGGALRAATHEAFITLFIFTSGISCSFSRSNGKRAIKMMIFALLFTAVTYAVQTIVNEKLAIYFNVIHVIALSVALWTIIEWAWSKCQKAWQKNVFGVVMTAVILTALVVGSVANTPKGAWTNQNPMWYFLARHKELNVFSEGGDFWPFFPDFGWFLIGAFLGRFLYREKKSLFPSVNPKWVSPITFCGRYSIWIYFGSQVVMYGVLYLLTSVAGVL